MPVRSWMLVATAVVAAACGSPSTSMGLEQGQDTPGCPDFSVSDDDLQFLASAKIWMTKEYAAGETRPRFARTREGETRTTFVVTFPDKTRGVFKQRYYGTANEMVVLDMSHQLRLPVVLEALLLEDSLMGPGMIMPFLANSEDRAMYYVGQEAFERIAKGPWGQMAGVIELASRQWDRWRGINSTILPDEQIRLWDNGKLRIAFPTYEESDSPYLTLNLGQTIDTRIVELVRAFTERDDVHSTVRGWIRDSTSGSTLDESTLEKLTIHLENKLLFLVTNGRFPLASELESMWNQAMQALEP